MKKHEKQLAIMVASNTTFGRGVLRGAIQYCKENPAWKIRFAWDNSADGLSRLTSDNIAGGLITEIWWPAQYRIAIESRLPVVEVSGGWSADRLASVHANNNAVGRLAARHLIERGFKRFAFYSSFPTGFKQVIAEHQLEGFGDELRKSGFSCECKIAELNLPWRFCSLGEVVSAQAILSEWLSGLPKPVGLMCSNDQKAEEAVCACRDAGIRVPEEVAIVGVGNDDLACEICSTPLSSVDLNPFKIGYAAATTIDRMHRTGKTPKKPIMVEPSGLVARESSNIFASDNKYLVAAMKFIQDHACEAIKVEDILKAVPISRRALEGYFRDLVGRSPSRHISHVRLETAKNLLEKTSISVDEVAKQCGFGSESVFSALFVRQEGIRPGKYRRQFLPETA